MSLREVGGGGGVERKEERRKTRSGAPKLSQEFV